MQYALIGFVALVVSIFAIRGILVTVLPESALANSEDPIAIEATNSSQPSDTQERLTETPRHPPKESEPPPVAETDNDASTDKADSESQDTKTSDQAEEMIAEAEQTKSQNANSTTEDVQKVDGPKKLVEDDITVVPPPIPRQILPIHDHEFSEQRRSIRLARTASDAYVLYQRFAKSYQFDDRQQEKVDDELAEWKERAEQGLHRLGLEWVSKDKVAEAAAEGEQLLQAAVDQLDADKFDEAMDLFEQASRADPNGIRPDYLQGLIYSLPIFGAEGPRNSEKHFRRVLVREPTHVGAMNSLAIALLKQNEYGDAYETFQNASNILPKCPEIVHNLARLVDLSQRERLYPPFAEEKDCEKLVRTLVSEGKGSGLLNRTGWLHMIPVFRDDESDSVENDEGTPDDVPDFINVCSGSGFVVAPEYVLTNRHVVEIPEFGIADRVGIPNHSDSAVETFGTVVAVSPSTDLALLHVPGLPSSPLSLRSMQVSLASDVLILGYPMSHRLGSQLKVTQGIVSALPDPKRALCADYYYFDAIADHGNSGGPILGRDGRVVAILTAGLAKTEFKAAFTAGVPAEAAIEFLQQHLSGYEPANSMADMDLNWSEVTELVHPSTHQVNVYFADGLPEIAQTTQSLSDQSVMEDLTCATCNGRSWFDCINKDCRKGVVSERRFRTEVVGVGAGRRIARVPYTVKIDCKGCRDGRIDCPNCSDGFDHELD